MMKMGRLNLITVGHDEGCPTLETQLEKDCTCEETSVGFHSDLSADQICQMITKTPKEQPDE